jgi:hypothetical protein
MTAMHAIELVHTVGGRAGPSPETLSQQVRDCADAAGATLLHVRTTRAGPLTYCVLFLGDVEAGPAKVVGAVIGALVAKAVPQLDFVGCRTWLPPDITGGPGTA